MRLPAGLAALTAAWLLSLVPARAQALTQPNGAVIPTPPSCASNAPSGLAAALACVCTQPGICNIGAPCASATSCDDGKRGTCETTLAHAWNDNTCIPSLASGLDPAAEAATTPETFHPTCALTFSVVTRGTAQFRDVFGWYNAGATKPAASDLHPMLGCGDGAGKSAVLDITREPAYAGGDIGFFLATPEAHDGGKQCAGGDCCATLPRIAAGQGYVYYSQRAYNPDQAGASSFIHLVILDSHLVKRKFYFAWEDIFGGSNNDFTDLVTSVDGVECAGGGEVCETGQKGICAQGVSACSQGKVGCVPIESAHPETCNGLDDDCNGAVDDGATCASPDAVCQNGACVHRCSGVEFPCGGGTACDRATGYCVDPACIGVTCAAGKICRAGACLASCDGVVCPSGQTCIADACVDLCAGVSCGGGKVCRGGACFAGCGQCDGVVCGGALRCDASSGQCADPSCPAGCGGGTVCRSGACVDACAGEVCPRGQSCASGRCGGGTASGRDGGGLSSGGGGSGGSSGPDGGAEASNAFDAHAASGCGCRVVGVKTGPGGAALGALAVPVVALSLSRRRARRRRPRAPQR